MKCLIIDDDLDVLQMLSDRVEALGYKTITASCGYDAIDLIVKHDIDVVLTDMEMLPAGAWVIRQAKIVSPHTHIAAISGTPERLCKDYIPEVDAFFYKPAFNKCIEWLTKLRLQRKRH